MYNERTGRSLSQHCWLHIAVDHAIRSEVFNPAQRRAEMLSAPTKMEEV